MSLLTWDLWARYRDDIVRVWLASNCLVGRDGVDDFAEFLRKYAPTSDVCTPVCVAHSAYASAFPDVPLCRRVASVGPGFTFAYCGLYSWAICMGEWGVA